MSAFERNIKTPQANSADIMAHLSALFPADFVHPFPDAQIEIAYGAPGKVDRAELFSAFRLDAAADFAVLKNGRGCNVYVGPTLKKGGTAPFARTTDDDFLAGIWAWSDHDAEGDFESAKDKAKEHNLTPSIIVETGTVPHVRAHCYYKIAGGSTDTEQMRAINSSVQKCLGGDPVQAPSHVMRLAGTVNYPTPKKFDRGYVIEPVKVRVQRKPREHLAATLLGLHPSGTASDRARKSSLGFDIPRGDEELAFLLEASRTPGKWHNSIRNAIATMIGRGWSDFAIRLACAPYCDFGAVDPDLTSLIDGAREKWGKPNNESEQTSESSKPPPRLIVPSADFLAGFIPPDYLIDGLIQRRFCYSLTAPTGHGKTAVALLLAASKGLGRPIGRHETEPGRVLYFVGENPDDVRMRWIVMSEKMSFDADTIDVHFRPGTCKLSELALQIRQEVEQIGGVSFVLVDTSAAYNESDDENANVQAGNHARLIRSLVTLPGEPCVLVLCHPIKNAQQDSLVPRGGGAFLAEVDGNLTCWRTDSLVSMHWLGKFRGPDFAPLSFQLETVTSERLKDSKGRLIPSVIAKALSETERSKAETSSRDDEDALLLAIADNDRSSFAGLAVALGWISSKGENKAKVKRCADRLKADKLVKSDRRGTLSLTDKGETEVKRLRSP